MSKDKRVGRGEALRRVLLAAMADRTRPAKWEPAWHPAVWAPFVVVGEGGAARVRPTFSRARSDLASSRA